MLSFEQVLSKAAADAASDKGTFRKGDSAHIARWLHDGRADEIWQNLHPGVFDRLQAYLFIIVMLSYRQLAEQLDQANERVSDAKGARRKTARRDARKRLAELRTELSPRGFVLTGVCEGALDSVETLEPFLADRERSARQRTLFCRLASHSIRHGTRWHDAQVGALCEIALNCKDSVTADMVRHAREAGRRDATRKSRRKA